MRDEWLRDYAVGLSLKRDACMLAYLKHVTVIGSDSDGSGIVDGDVTRRFRRLVPTRAR